MFAGLSAQPEALSAARVVLIAAFGASCALVGAFGRTLAPVRERRALLAGCGVATAAGMLLGSLPALGLPLWLLYPGALVRGCAGGFFVLSWIDRLAGLDARGVGVALCAALAAYGAAGVVIPLAAQACAPAAAVLLAACPLASCWGCERLADTAPERSRPVAVPEPMTRAGAVLFACSNLVYGFVFGVMLSHFCTLGTLGLYAAFALVAALSAAVFALWRRAVDLNATFRICTGIGAAALVASALAGDAAPALAVVVEACVWGLLIFFTVVIFTDAEFSIPGRPGLIGGMALAAASAGMLAATLLVPPAGVESLSSPVLLAASLAAMLYLALVFLPNGRSWISRWGFSSFVAPESRETFRMRRIGELTAQYGLTKREFEVLDLLAQGKNKDAISAELVLSPLTVKTHARNIYAKLDVHTQRELVELVERGREE